MAREFRELAATSLRCVYCGARIISRQCFQENGRRPARYAGLPYGYLGRRVSDRAKRSACLKPFKAFSKADLIGLDTSSTALGVTALWGHRSVHRALRPPGGGRGFRRTRAIHISIIDGCHFCHTEGYREAEGKIDPAKALKGSSIGRGVLAARPMQQI